MKMFGATKISHEPGKPQGYQETGSVSSAIPDLGFSAHSSNGAAHTYQMEADALTEVGHHGFVVDAQAMTALLFDVAAGPDYRTAIKREFDGIKPPIWRVPGSSCFCRNHLPIENSFPLFSV